MATGEELIGPEVDCEEEDSARFNTERIDYFVAEDIAELMAIDKSRLKGIVPPVSAEVTSVYQKSSALGLVEYVVDLIVKNASEADSEVTSRPSTELSGLVAQAVKGSYELVSSPRQSADEVKRREESLRSARPIALDALDIIVEAYNREFPQPIDEKSRNIAVGALFYMLMPKSQVESF